MIFQKATKTMFKPSFGNKKGQTDFYQILIDNKPVAEIEIKPINKFGKPEILSAFTENYCRGRGVGQMLVKEVLDIYLKDEMWVLTTKESKLFWIKMGAVETEGFDGFMCKFTK